MSQQIDMWYFIWHIFFKRKKGVKMLHASRYVSFIGPALTVAYSSRKITSKKVTLCTGQRALSGGASYPANNPSEDRYLSYNDTSSSCRLIAVMDGHGGWQVANYVCNSLIDKLKSKNIFEMNFRQDGSVIDKKLSDAFHDLEDGYLNQVRSAYRLGFGSVASVGCCALVALHKDSHLIIANCGDCRAVLGHQSIDGNKYHAITITKDHNCREYLEQVLILMLFFNQFKCKYLFYR